MTSTTVATASILLAVSASLQVTPPIVTQPPLGVLAHRTDLLSQWVTAVERHKPGEGDAAALVPHFWNAEELPAMWIDLQVFISLLRDPASKTFYVQPADARVQIRVNTTRSDLAAMRTLADKIHTRGDVDAFLKRAALLHTDTVMFVEEPSGLSAVWSSMLTPQRLVVRTMDGQQKAIHGGAVHWEFARVLLDAVTEPSRDEFVRNWYRATLAHKLSREELDTPHFAHADRLFARDAVIQFQKGCLHESFADPRVQAVAHTVSLPPHARLNVGSESEELGQAHTYFRRALDIDPTHVEARLRRGRVRGRLGKHEEAAADLRLALAGTRSMLLTYYALLFVGAEEEALGRYEQARAAYDEALKRYPRAQAPRLALSQLAHRTGDRLLARESLSSVLKPPDGKLETDEPWWAYRVAAGRQADDLLAALYRALDAPPRPQS